MTPGVKRIFRGNREQSLLEQRRERIATAVMAAVAHRESRVWSWPDLAEQATKAADSLIAELDK